MIFIGVTGGIGSGKSLLCSYFVDKGVQIFSADQVAKEIPSRYPEILKKISDTFGPETIDVQAKRINPAQLAEIVFASSKKVEQLNNIIHPVVFQEFEEWKQRTQFRAPYALAEAALLFESGMDELVDYSLVVAADEELRIDRVKKKFSPKQFVQRSSNQLPSEEIQKLADFVIQNNGSESDLQSKVEFFHPLFLSLTKRIEE